MMPTPRKPRATDAAGPFRLRVVGHASRLPEPCRIELPGGVPFDFDLLTEAEWRLLGPGDEPETFVVLRAGMMGRARRTAGGAGPGVAKPDWMD